MSQMVGIKSGLHHHHSWALDDDDRQRLCSVYSKADDAFMTHRVFSLLAGWLADRRPELRRRAVFHPVASA